MRQASHILTVSTPGAGLHEITRDVARWVGEQGMQTGLLTLFCRHTSASLLIQENADPDVAAISRTSSPGSRRRALPTAIRTRVPTTCRPTCAPP